MQQDGEPTSRHEESAPKNSRANAPVGIGSVLHLFYIEPPLGEVRVQLVESLKDDTKTGLERKVTRASLLGRHLLNARTVVLEEPIHLDSLWLRVERVDNE
jgi:hypothetical protein